MSAETAVNPLSKIPTALVLLDPTQPLTKAHESRMTTTMTTPDTSNATVPIVPLPIAYAETHNVNLYLLPTSLTPNEANEKARPGESTEARKARVLDISASIKANGQIVPVLVTEIPGDAENGEVITYEYIDGGSRVDAIAAINAALVTGQTPMRVWCSIIPGDVDFFRIAVTSNMHRADNTLLQMAAICQETAERNGFKGRGAGIKVAEYLGLLESRVSEYKKIAIAASRNPKLKAMIEDGTIPSVDAALKLMSLPEELRDDVAERSLRIATERVQAQAPVAAVAATATTDDAAPSDTAHTDAPASDPAAATEAVTTGTPQVHVTGADVAAAAREVNVVVGPRNRKTILEFFVEKTGPAYSPSVNKFAVYLTETWAAGGGSDRHADKLFDAMVPEFNPPVSEPTKTKKAPKVAAVAAAA